MTVGSLRERCSVLEPGVILVREAPRSNADVFLTFMAAARDLGAPFDQFVIVNDLTDAKTRPKGEHLAAILDAPEPERAVVGGDALADARQPLGGRSDARRAADVAHHVGIAVEGDEVALVGRAQPAEPESRGLDASGLTIP